MVVWASEGIDRGIPGTQPSPNVAEQLHGKLIGNEWSIVWSSEQPLHRAVDEARYNPLNKAKNGVKQQRTRHTLRK